LCCLLEMTKYVPPRQDHQGSLNREIEGKMKDLGNK